MLITFTGNAAILQELTRVYGITEDIFRHIVVEKCHRKEVLLC